MIGIFLLAFAVTGSGLFLFFRFAKTWGFLDQPDGERKKHQGPKPIAGVALGIGILSTFWLWSPSPFLAALLTGGLAFLLLGADDDRQPRPAKWRLLGQFLIATGIVFWGQIQFQSFSLEIFSIELGWLAIPFTVFWLVSLVNAFNFIDGSDGLSLGIALIIALGFALGSSVPLVQQIAWAITGSGVLFWWFNKPTATAFLGDGGAYLLGFLLGMLSLLDAQVNQNSFSGFGMALIFLIPLGDTLFAIARRLRAKRPIFSADYEHIHHRLKKRFGNWGMLAWLYGITILGVIISLFFD